MSLTDSDSKPRRVHRGLAVACILIALYLPQSWFFLMDYPWNDYWRSWLKLLPGLPVFIPFAIVTHPHDTLMMWSLWLVTGVVAAALYLLSRKLPVFFWVGVVGVCALSIVSAFGAYGAFKM